MATEIKVWQIENGKLVLIDATMAGVKRTEPEDLEQWIKGDPSILGQDILIIGSKYKQNPGLWIFLE